MLSYNDAKWIYAISSSSHLNTVARNIRLYLSMVSKHEKNSSHTYLRNEMANPSPFFIISFFFDSETYDSFKYLWLLLESIFYFMLYQKRFDVTFRASH